MATNLRTTASHTDGSAKVINYEGDPKGVNQNEQITLEWDGLDPASIKTLVDLYNSATVLTGAIVADADISYGTGWYAGFTPRAEQNDQRGAILRVTFTKDTLTGVDFPYEDRSIAAYSSVKTPSYTETRAVIKNAKTAPAEPAVYGSTTYVLNQFRRFDGLQTARTYTGGTPSGGGGYTAETTVDPYQKRAIEIYSKDQSQVDLKVMTTSLKMTASAATAITWINLSTAHPETGKNLGYFDYNRRYAVYMAYKVVLTDHTPNSAPF